MKLTTLEEVVERLLKARQAQERAERKLQAAKDGMQRISGEIKALGVDPDNQKEAIRKLEQEIEAELAA